MHESKPPGRVRGFRWYGRTDKGRVRPGNEDAFLGLQLAGREVRRLGKIGQADNEEADYVFAVSDGVGGAQAGEFASRIVVDKLTTISARVFAQRAAGFEGGLGDVLTDLFAKVHVELASLGRSYEECRGMEATLTLAWLSADRLFFGHVGDSRLYLLSQGAAKPRQLTVDDTHVAWLLKHGRITEHEARTHPRRRVLQKSLGGGNQFVDPQLGAVTVAPGDTLLLCSDGLMEGLYEHHLIDMLGGGDVRQSDADLASRLVDVSVQNDGSDNVTALVVQAL
jgi:PPM family protein phosphatase